MDGTNLTNDTIFIGREGSTTIIGSDMLVSGNASLANATLQNVSMTGTLAVAGNVSMNNVSCTGLNVTGNVGIGISIPTAKLDISGNYPLRIRGTWDLAQTNGCSDFLIGDAADFKSMLIRSIPGTSAATARMDVFCYGVNIPVSIVGNGYVGIGTTTPDTQLHVIGSMKVTGQVTMGSGTSGVYVYSNDTYIQGPIAVGATNKNAIANFIGTSGFPTQIACRPYSDSGSIQDFYSTAGSVRGAIQGSSGSSISYATSSDRRLKNNIEPLDPMLDKMMSLKPSKYIWKSDNANGFGFIAQEVYEVFPHMRIWTPQMSGDIDEPRDEQGNPIHYGLDYGQFTPYIVKALQEMKQDYESKLAALEARLDALERS
jgi:hypothetical protein